MFKTVLTLFRGSVAVAGEELEDRAALLILDQQMRDAGAAVERLDLRELALPVYDGDIEAEAMPDNARRLQELMARHDGLLISTPEYNGSMPALVKNTLDWISRPLPDGRSGTTLFADKVAGIVSASPGPLGGLRSLLVLRDALAKLGLIVVPQQVAVGQAGDKLHDYGELSDERQREAVHRVGAAVVRHLRVQGAAA